ncbi:MAG: hypothetical protein R3E54_05515 [Halioglobus sp.]
MLDVTLAMARLLDGHAREHDASECLSADMALAGIATALFHDSGYIRRTRDTRHHNGAAYTRVHVSRGARFLRDFLPEAGLERIAPVCTRIIHYTGYEREPEEFVLEDPGEHLLGMLLGTADLMAQMADSNYLHKCREHLYQEFVTAGLADAGHSDEATGTIYRSPEQLLRMTPAFILNAIDVRLNGHFSGVHRYAAAHFGGRHLYMEAITANSRRLEILLAGEAQDTP